MRRSSSQQSLADLCGTVELLSNVSAAPRKIESGKGRNSTVKVHRRLRKNRIATITVLEDLKRTSRKSQAAFLLRSSSSPKLVSTATKVLTNDPSGNKLVLLNLLAALYGLGNVVSKSVDVAATPASLNLAVKYASALLVVLPFLIRNVKLNKDDAGHTRAGLELGIWSFAHSFFASCSPRSTDTSATSLLYTLTVFSFPVLQLCAGKSIKVPWLATAATLFGMGLLEEEGAGWKGVVLPSFGNLWAVTDAIFSIFQIVRSESLFKDRDPVRVNATQLVLLLVLNIAMELSHLNSWNTLLDEAQTLPWCPLLIGGLVCLGLGSLLEMRGLAGVDASTIAMSSLMIPVWGAFFSLLEQGRPFQEIALLSGMVFVVARFCDFFTRQLLKQRVTAEKDQTMQKTCHRSSKKSTVGNHQMPVVIFQLKYPYYANQAQALLGDMDSNINSRLELLENSSSPDHQTRQLQEIYQDNALHNHPARDWIHITTSVHGDTLLDSAVHTVHMMAGWVEAASHSILTILIN